MKQKLKLIPALSIQRQQAGSRRSGLSVPKCWRCVSERLTGVLSSGDSCITMLCKSI